MSEDEDTDAGVTGVPSEEVSDETDADEPSESASETAVDPDPDGSTDDTTASDCTSTDDTDRDLEETVEDQRAELSDLRERVEEQAATIDRLQSERDEQEATIEEQTARIDELESALKRTKADFQNYKKRAKKRQEQLEERATEDLVTRLVDVRDNLKRALEEEDGDVEALREGVEMTMREFDRVLEEENVEEIDPDPGTEVDPQRHEVMVKVDSALPEGTIDEVYTSGYEMAGTVIQDAQVTVSNGALAEDDPAADAEDGSDDDADA